MLREGFPKLFSYPWRHCRIPTSQHHPRRWCCKSSASKDHWIIPELVKQEKISDIIKSNLKIQQFVLSQGSQSVRELKCGERERFVRKTIKIYQLKKKLIKWFEFWDESEWIHNFSWKLHETLSLKPAKRPQVLTEFSYLNLYKNSYKSFFKQNSYQLPSWRPRGDFILGIQSKITAQEWW